MVEPDITGLIPGIKMEDPDNPIQKVEDQTKKDEKSIQTDQGKPDEKPKIELIAKDQSQPPDLSKQQPIEEKYSLKDIFEEDFPFKTVDEIKQAKISERLKKLTELENQLPTISKENLSLKDRLAVLNDPEYLTALKYSHFSKETGIKDYTIFNKIETVDLDKLDDVKVLELHDFIKFGDNGRTRDEIMEQYDLGDYAAEDGDGNKVEKEIDKKALRRDALTSKKEISTLKEKLSSFKPEIKDGSKERETNITSWKDVPDKMVPHFVNLDIPIKEIKGIPIDVSYQYTPEDKIIIKKILKEEIERRNVPLTQENVAAIYQDINAVMFKLKIQELFKLFGEKLYGNIGMKLQSKYSNFSWDESTPDRKQPLTPNIPEGGMTISQIEKEQLAAQR